jgi:simple sugar transport system permease protein
VAFAFKTGLFNIGASGQFIVGGFVAVFIGVRGAGILPGNLHWIVALLAAIVAGALWATLPGILKAYFNVHEVISCIMMNYIGMYLVNLLITQSIYDSLKNQTQTPADTAIIPKLGLDKLFGGSSANAGIFIALAAVVVIYILLNKTAFGYELKACGYNRDASHYAGINARRGILLSMIIAGALSGLAGGLVYLAGAGKHIEVVDVLAAEGFNGIPVALLGMSNPIGVFFAGLFIAYITVGGFYMQLYDYVPQIIDIIIAAIIYFSAFALVFRSLITRFMKAREPSIPKDRQGGAK